ncbi:class I SAM-dependent methyltransferase [Pollutimonas bauzanensis]|uniref:Methyltransferase domain-containing protein n=1 Tax=Pollutimonas bauzanensis TaxID=658167 RepID=A0A1M5ZTZ0_9BURK|nr:class I SAM-dependent methyltransferase [Pollutimonas bauzanensis]SHI27737.1 Methyltransferase domain-containing protein [Pollutimonas bauzanensis]
MLPFDLPPPAGFSSTPYWNGKAFVVDGQDLQILEYSENFAGWSDDLTALHEEAAGDSHPIDLASRNDAIAQIKRCLPGGQGVVMEIGCSSGFLIRDLVKALPQATIIGADVVKDPLFRLADTLPGIPLIRFDLLQCPLPEQSIDVLVMLNVLEHIEDDVGALNNAYKLLKPGGYLVIEVPACPFLYDSYDAELHHFRRYAASDLHNKLQGVGFQIRRKSHLGFLLFPAFAAVKLLNKMLPSRKDKPVVGEQAKRTSGNGIVKIAMELESRYMASWALPFGVRALAVAQRPG